MKTEILEKEEQIKKRITEQIEEICARLKLDINYQELNEAVDFFKNCTSLKYTPAKKRFIVAKRNNHVGSYDLYFDTYGSSRPDYYFGSNNYYHDAVCFKLTLVFQAEPEKIKRLFSSCNYGKLSFTADARYNEILTIKINI